jgi:hypothetical protein
MGNERLGSALRPPADEAARLILHHVHGGLHNAAMSLQLAAEYGKRGRAGADDARLYAQSGLEGVAQAARGVSLLTVMLGLSHGSGHALADRQWVQLVESLLRRRAVDRHVDADIALDLAPRGGDAPDAEQLVATLLDGIAAIDAAAPGARVTLPRAMRETA